MINLDEMSKQIDQKEEEECLSQQQEQSTEIYEEQQANITVEEINELMALIEEEKKENDYRDPNIKCLSGKEADEALDKALKEESKQSIELVHNLPGNVKITSDIKYTTLKPNWLTSENTFQQLVFDTIESLKVDFGFYGNKTISLLYLQKFPCSVFATILNSDNDFTTNSEPSIKLRELQREIISEQIKYLNVIQDEDLYDILVFNTDKKHIYTSSGVINRNFANSLKESDPDFYNFAFQLHENTLDDSKVKEKNKYHRILSGEYMTPCYDTCQKCPFKELCGK